MSELKPCPNPECTHEIAPRAMRYDGCWVYCESCDTTGPNGFDEDGATRLWNILPRTDYRALAQELVTVLHRYEKKLRYTSDEMDMDAIDVLLKAREAGLEVP